MQWTGSERLLVDHMTVDVGVPWQGLVCNAERRQGMKRVRMTVQAEWNECVAIGAMSVLGFNECLVCGEEGGMQPIHDDIR